MRSASWWGSINASIYAVTVLKTQLTLEFTATQILQEGNSATPLRQGQKESAIEGTGDQNCNYLGKHAIIISWPVVMISCKQVPFEVKSIRRWSSSLKFAEGFAGFFMHFQAKKLELLLSVKRIAYDRLGPPIFWKLSVLAAGNEGGKLQWAEVYARVGGQALHPCQGSRSHPGSGCNAASLKHRSFDQSMNTTMQITQLSKDHSAGPVS